MSEITAAPGELFPTSLENAPPGLVGQAGVRIVDPPDTEVMARTTDGIAEFPPDSGNYSTELVAPLIAGFYDVIWDTGGPAPIFRTATLEVTVDVGGDGGGDPGLWGAAEVRAWAPPQFSFAAAGYPAPAGAAADPLEKQVEWAIGYVAETTGRAMDDTLPDNLVGLAEQAVVLRTMQQAAAGKSTALAAIFDAPWIRSFTAGSYSQTRFSPSELAAVKAVNSLLPLAEILWLLMTEAKRDEWLERSQGRVKPAGTFVPMGFDPVGDGLVSPYDERGFVQ